MRSMLISLIFFCSLTQFAIAAPETKIFKECGTIYYCYVPEMCTDASLATNPWSDYGVKEVKPDTKVNVDCPAIIRYHLYNSKWVVVTIESYRPIADIDDVRFVHRDKKVSNPEIFREFSCQLDKPNENIIGKINNGVDNNGVKYDVTYSQKSAGKPNLMCEFQVKNKGTKEIFVSGAFNRILFIIKNIETMSLNASPEKEPKCDPSFFNYYVDEKKPTHKYAMVQYKPGEFYCKDSRYKIQFREDGSNDDYKIADEIACHVDTFKIGQSTFESVEIDIRCVAEAKFFCKYDAKPLNSPSALKTPVEGPDMDLNKESIMKCPPGKPHLIIAGNVEPFRNAKFECLNYGNDPVWTVEKETITAEGPEVYCTDDVECALFYTIPESSVKNGILGETDFLPTCFEGEGGTLYLEEAGKPTKNVTTKCDRRTGEFKYVEDGGEFVIGDGTKFVCTYPKVNINQKNEENAKKILTGVFVAAGLGGFIILLGTGIGCACVIRRVKKDREEASRVTDAAWFQYAADAHEKKAHKVTTLKTNKGTLENGVEEQEKWNGYQMSSQYRAMSYFETGDGAVKQGEFFLRQEGNKPLANSTANRTAGCELTKWKDNEKPKYGWHSFELEFILGMKDVFTSKMTGAPKKKQNNSKKSQ